MTSEPAIRARTELGLRPTFEERRWLLARLDMCATVEHEVEQTLARCFPDEFPKYPPDWDAGDDVCVGDHVMQSLATKAAAEIERLREVLSRHT